MKENKKAINSILLAVLTGTVLVFAVGYLYFQRTSLQSQTEYQNKKLALQEAQLEATRSSALVPLMSELLRKADEELKASSNRSLSDSLINKIAVLSRSLKPYRLILGDSLSTEKFSPERGQLLIMLLTMDIDSASFAQLKEKVSFEHADLAGANLNEAPLQGVFLKGANLRDAILRRANLQHANLYQADMWGADLYKASLMEADLKRVDMSWANLNEADLRSADLCSATLHSTQLNHADLSNSLIKWAYLNDASAKAANFQYASLLRTELNRADLSGADLSHAILKKAKVREANFSGTILMKANLIEAVMFHTVVTAEDWMEKLDTWEVEGAASIREKFDLVKENTAQPSYRLEKPKE